MDNNKLSDIESKCLEKIIKTEGQFFFKSKILEEPTFRMESPLFGSNIDKSTQWSIILCIDKDNLPNTEDISILLKLVKEETNKINVLVEFKLMDCCKKTIEKFQPVNTMYDKENKIYGFRTNINKIILMKNIPHEPRSASVFFIAYKIYYIHNKTTSEINDDLSKDMFALLSNGNLHDFEITHGQKIYQLHKCILGARSKVFWDLFSSNMTVGNIEIKKFNEKSIFNMIHYIYTNKLHDDIEEEDMVDTIEVMKSFQVNGYEKTIQFYLMSKINVKNVLDYLVLSKNNDLKVLREWCIQYIVLNAEELMKTKEWENFVHTHYLLLPDIFFYLISNSI